MNIILNKGRNPKRKYSIFKIAIIIFKIDLILLR